MRRALIISVTAHLTLAAVGYMGLPALRADAPLIDDTLIVDVVVVDEETNVPTARPEPEPPKKAEIPPPPPPSPETAAPPPPPPQVAARPPEPEPEPEPAPLPKALPKPEAKPKPEPEPAAKPKPPQRLAQVKLRRKPKPPDPFASVLRTVEELKKRPSPSAKKKAEKKKPPPAAEDFKTQMARAIQARARTFDASRPLTASQIDLVRQQISNCWNVHAGSKDAEDLIIEIHIVMNRDGFVRSAKIVDSARVQSDHFFRSAAETALRAVLNKRCQPFKLPRDRYDQWQTITMTFDPREMF
jgi:hypothetical protein